MIRHRNVCGLLLLVVLFSYGVPQTAAADVGIAARAGTQGWGVEGAVGFTKFFSLRGGFYDATISENVEEGGIDYDGDLNLGGYGLFADFFPFRGGFHITGGLMSNENSIDIVATPTQPQEIGNMVYQPAEIGQLIGAVKFDDEVPYLGVGWGNVARGKRFGFVIDLGVIDQGDPAVSLLATNGAVDPADLAAEAAELEDEITDYDLWPILSVGVAFRF